MEAEDDDIPRPAKRGRGEYGSFANPTLPPLPNYDSTEAFNSRIVMSQTHWVYRHIDDVVEVINWLVDSKKVEAERIVDFLSSDNARDRVDLAFLNRIIDEAGSKHYALRFSTRLEDLRHRHQHDLLRLLNYLVKGNAVLLTSVEKKLQQISFAQSEIRKKLREQYKA